MQSIYLLDTNIILEMTKPEPNQKVISKIFEKQNESKLCTITFAEALYGIKQMQSGKKQELFLDFYVNTIQKMYTFADFDLHSANIYSDVKSRLKAIGKPAQELNLQIASIAIANNLILVTRNQKDFENILQVSNLMIENWFE